MKIIFAIFLIVGSLYSSLMIGAASNTVFVMTSIKEAFNAKYPNIKLKISYASSGQLTNQILHNAPFDIFLSANMKYPQKLFEMNKTLLPPRVYAKGLLIAFTTCSDTNLTQDLAFLNTKDVEDIAVANSEYAPYGIATKELLQNLNMYESIKNKLVTANNIAATATLALKATDVGFISKSALFSQAMSNYNIKNTHFIEINTKIYSPINQGVIILKNSKHKKEAKLFYDFLFSKTSKQIFTKFGYK